MIPRRGFSLAELLIVLGLLGILFSLALAAISRVRGAADKVQCQNHLRQIGLALHLRHNDHGSFFLTGWGAPPRQDPPEFRTYLSWMTHLLPYLDRAADFEQALQASRQVPQPLRNPPHVGLTTVVKVYTCPADGRLGEALTDVDGRRAAFTSYLGIQGIGRYPQGFVKGVFGSYGRLAEIRDGASNTLMIAERPPPGSLIAGWWYPAVPARGRRNAEGAWIGPGGPNLWITLGALSALPDGRFECTGIDRFLGPGRLENDCDRYHLWSLHPGGAFGLFADGSVHFLAYPAHPLVGAWATIAGGELVASPDA
jgi:prepilin-type N-terminal cleavage/methylation domain-containing protein